MYTWFIHLFGEIITNSHIRHGSSKNLVEKVKVVWLNILWCDTIHGFTNFFVQRQR